MYTTSMNIFERLYQYILGLTKPRASRYRWIRRLPLKKLDINTSIRINFELVQKKNLNLRSIRIKQISLYEKKKRMDMIES